MITRAFSWVEDVGVKSRQLFLAACERFQGVWSAAGCDERRKAFDCGEGRRHGMKEGRRRGADNHRHIRDLRERRHLAVGDHYDLRTAVARVARRSDGLPRIGTNGHDEKDITPADRPKRIGPGPAGAIDQDRHRPKQ